jgi:hypothetical protein
MPLITHLDVVTSMKLSRNLDQNLQEEKEIKNTTEIAHGFEVEKGNSNSGSWLFWNPA